MGIAYDPLDLKKTSDSDRTRQEAAIRRLLSGQRDEGDLLQMVGLECYTPGKRPKERPRVVHGRRSTYVKHGCKCGPCTEANTAYIAARREVAA